VSLQEMPGSGAEAQVIDDDPTSSSRQRIRDRIPVSQTTFQFIEEAPRGTASAKANKKAVRSNGTIIYFYIKNLLFCKEPRA